MSLQLLIKSVIFAVEGLLLLLALLVSVHFEIGRLLFAIAVGGLCAFAEIFVIAKIGQRLWKWSGKITSMLALERTAKAKSQTPTNVSRGEA